VDAHLIAAARIADVELWTLDRALQRAWEKLAS
jgi:predicted nucleic acid-binding protein